MLFFQSKASKQRMSAVMNAMVVMCADGEISDDEKEMLMAIAHRVEMPEKEFRKLLANPEKIKFVMPKDDDEKIQQILDAVWMMMIDGDIDENEFDICVSLAVRMGFKPSIVKEMIKFVAERIKKGTQQEKVKEEIEAFLKG